MGSYFGSKATSGLCQAIIALMPPHDTSIETHLGGGAIMKRKPPALHNIGIDLHTRSLARFDCAHRFLAEYPFAGRELVCCDPPYLRGTRTSNRRCRSDDGAQDHIALLEPLKGLPCHVILSGYPSALHVDETSLRAERSNYWIHAHSSGGDHAEVPPPQARGGEGGGRGRPSGRSTSCPAMAGRSSTTVGPPVWPEPSAAMACQGCNPLAAIRMAFSGQLYAEGGAELGKRQNTLSPILWPKHRPSWLCLDQSSRTISAILVLGPRPVHHGAGSYCLI